MVVSLIQRNYLFCIFAGLEKLHEAAQIIGFPCLWLQMSLRTDVFGFCVLPQEFFAFHIQSCLWAEFCPPKIPKLKSSPLALHHVTLLGDWVFTEVTNWKWGHRMCSNPAWLVYLEDGEVPTQTCTEGRWGSRQPSIRQGQRPRGEAGLPTLGLQNYEKINLCCLSHLVFNSLSQQP